MKGLKVKEKIKLTRNIYFLKTLIHYLTLHSWGNCKRLFTLFESFVRPNPYVKGQHQLFFSRKDIQRLVLASHLYILFHHNLSRILLNADDKLVVSSLSSFHYIMKYHGIGFSRGHILRMYETINVHSSPELSHIVDIIIHNVLRSHVRRIRNSFYRYRFSFLHEQEIHFITTINDAESAVFNFSLNAMDAVKQHYRNLIANSQYTHTDRQYGNAALASIHVVVGNFHFWEQSYDEANIQYGIALDILEKESGSKNELAKIDIVVQQIEVFLRQGSVAERMGNYSSAASIYISAEDISNKCLKTLYSNGIKDQDSKWDVLRQPKWAKYFLNLKRSAIHYNQHNNLDQNTSDVSRYRNAVLSFFMEDYSHAFSGFMSVTNLLKEDQGNERAYFLEGNAYLKAGFSLLLNNSYNLHKKFNNEDKNRRYQDQNHEEACKNRIKNILKILVDSIDSATTEICRIRKRENGQEISENLEYFESLIKDDLIIGSINNGIMMDQAIGLIKKSASSFERGRLNVNAAISYLSIVMMWEALLEMLPWQWIKKNASCTRGIQLDPDTTTKMSSIRNKIKKLRNDPDNWIFTAQEKTFELTKNNTGAAFSHFMKTALSRDANIEISETLFSDHDKARNHIIDDKFLNNYIFQHYSVFGQSMIASMYWEEITAQIACQTAKEISSVAVGSLMEGEILPYGIRYYSTMLWLKGRIYLDGVIKIPFGKCFSKKDPLYLSDKIKMVSANALINLFRSSQYVIKTHSKTSSMALPPLFIIYYNMWEVLFHLVSLHKTYAEKNNTKYLFSKAVAKVRDEMDKVFKENKVEDVTTRILDLKDVTQMATEQFKIVERMGDLNSRDRTSIIRNKYFLDDDYEDNMFNLDWCYCRFLAPGVLVHRLILESEMQWLKQPFEPRKLLTYSGIKRDHAV